MEIVIATSNPNKLREIEEIYNSNSSNNNIKFILPEKDFNPVENGKNFEENSLIKAKEAYRVSGKMCLADDSGLCVDALNGAPGIYSARFANTQDEKITKLLDELKEENNRKARFVCCMTLLDKNGSVLHISNGICDGEIVKERRGVNGFGYDPVFLVNGYDLTMAELPSEEKNKISHRAKALSDMLKFLENHHE